jgi:hypothetical protein
MEMGQDRGGDRLVVVDDVALGEAGGGIQDLVPI